MKALFLEKVLIWKKTHLNARESRNCELEILKNHPPFPLKTKKCLPSTSTGYVNLMLNKHGNFCKINVKDPCI